MSDKGRLRTATVFVRWYEPADSDASDFRITVEAGTRTEVSVRFDPPAESGGMVESERTGELSSVAHTSSPADIPHADPPAATEAPANAVTAMPATVARAAAPEAVESVAPVPALWLLPNDRFVLRVLIESAQRAGGDTTDPTSKNTIAALCGVTRRKVELSLGRLAAEGLIAPLHHESGSTDGRRFLLAPEAFAFYRPRAVA